MSKAISEIRFAVVMYGGLSLAIYINGVAQELLKMVRATSGAGADRDSTKKVYHKIACLLGNAEKLEEAARAPTNEEIEKIVESVRPEDCSPTKFIVDILSGTSAGGINAVFLAKALANRQEIDQLKQLWLDEGEIAKLINDKNSVRDTKLKNPEKIQSLFNSQRMYLKLLDALEGMEGEVGDPDVEQLDLFVTVTDFAGVTVPIRLSDKIVDEKMYKQALHFRLENGTNDFKRKHNPMLAFAARSTSAFPFAFEPMRLRSAKDVINRSYPEAASMIENLSADIARLFPLTKDSKGREIKWEQRDLVDGGVLDNKPFGHAINTISTRSAEVNVQRKLIYIEPSPELFDLDDAEREPPDALTNLKACAAELPSYETIREDLERVLERNRLIERVNRFISGAEKDVFNYRLNIVPKLLKKRKKTAVPRAEKKTELPEDGRAWEKKGLEDIVQWKGNAALPYYRLRIATLTDELAQIVSRKMGVAENSEFFRVVQTLVRVWRKENYGYYRKENSPDEGRDKTVLYFLREFDLSYRLRRLRFVLNKADELYRFTEKFQEDLRVRQNQVSRLAEQSVENFEPPTMQQAGFTLKNPYGEPVIKKTDTENGAEPEEKTSSEIIWEKCGKQNAAKPANIEKMRRVVEMIQEELGEPFDLIRKEKEKLFQKKSEAGETPGEKSDRLPERGDFEAEIAGIELGASDLEKILNEMNSVCEPGEDGIDEASDRKILEYLKKDYAEVLQSMNRAAEKLSGFLDIFLKQSRAVADRAFEPVESALVTETGETIEADLVNAVRGYLRHYYKYFDDLSDQIAFPIFYETPVGEAVPIRVVRISPRDAKGLIDEEDPNLKRKKLAGTQFFNFGAFFDQVWRKNDIMWGRLDGAERLVTALLSDEKYARLRDYFTRRAHEVILEEELLMNNERALQNEFGRSLLKSSAGIDLEKAVGSVTGRISSDALKKRLAEVLGACIEKENVYDYVKTNFEIDRRLEPKPVLQVISRSTKVTGDILDNIAEERKTSTRQLRWITRLGQVFWGLVEVAAPNSFWNLLFYNWLNLIYFFEVMVIVVSTFLVSEDIQKFGVIALVFTLLTHMTVVTLTDVMKGGRKLVLARYFGVAVMAVLAFSGLVFLLSFFFYDDFWTRIVSWQNNWTRIPSSQRMLAAFPITALALYLIWQKSDKPERPEVKRVVIVFLTAFLAVSGLIRWFSSDVITETNPLPLVSLSFADNANELSARAGDFDSAARKGVKRALAVDSYLLVPVYAGFMFYLAMMLRLKRVKWAKFTGLLAAIFIFLAALADLTENYFLFSLLNMKPPDINRWLFNVVKIAAAAKWSAVLFAILSLVAGGLYLWFGKRKPNGETA